MTALALDEVTFAYGADPVVRAATVAVAPGDLVAVVGPNGAGKSTLLRIAAGLLAPSSGVARVFDAVAATTPRRRLARSLAYLPQDYHIVFPFSALEVVVMGRYPHLPPFALEGEAEKRLALDAMTRCDVAALARRRFSELSGGERRRVLLAQAFCQAAPLLLLDEPTASLDPAHAVSVFRLLVEAARGGTAVVLVTHDLNLAARFASRVVVMSDGRVAADGPPLAILGSPRAAEVFATRLHVGELPDGAPFVVPA